MSLSFSAVQAHNVDDLAGLISIYQEAIEQSEQKSPSEIMAMLGDKRYAFAVCKSDGLVRGFTISYFPESSNFWLLEYMAVDSHARGKGIGESIFLHAYQYGMQRDPARMCVLEVDKPGDTGSPNNDTRGRFRFYKRLGCRAVEKLNYILPLDTHGAPPPMLLLTYRKPPLDALDKRQLRQWLTTIYQSVYGQSSDDPRIDVMMSHLPDTIPVVDLE